MGEITLSRPKIIRSRADGEQKAQNDSPQHQVEDVCCSSLWCFSFSDVSSDAEVPLSCPLRWNCVDSVTLENFDPPPPITAAPLERPAHLVCHCGRNAFHLPAALLLRPD